ncbi:hypothetical protein V7x_43370 [Crateriforma conspicua]|uniref:Bacterial Pleckstrin homology domain-containing protein n=1 Tax=Crateriforma conspicua TaxID=2527996 RepID=A0A5C6FN51_9PLAN|nr:hypothetical protein V7x_43370 [Crateriforma conspicua]
MQYSHTQKAPLHLLLFSVACLLLVIASQNVEKLAAASITALVAGVFIVLALSFRSLTVSDNGEWLSVRFGPIPLFHKRILYSAITRVEAGRSSVFDGWGIHWLPMRDWTYNLWGFRCVVLHLGNRTIRVGTDDVEGLVRFLSQRTSARMP